MALNTSWSNRLVADLQRDFGLSLGAAQGMAGAMAMESEGFNTMQERSPTVAGSKGGFGMAMWTGVRRTAFENYANKQGLDVNSYDAQYGYLSQELKGVGGHDNNIIKKLKDVTDPQTAQAIFTGSAAGKTGFLRPGIVHPNARADWTNQVVGNYVKLPPGELPQVATKLDVNPGGVDLSRLTDTAPVPESRAKGVAARTNAALNLSVPTNKTASVKPATVESDRTWAAELAGQTINGVEFNRHGHPTDPATGLVMQTNDPRVKPAITAGLAQLNSGTPAPRIQAKLPELGPPTPLSSSAVTSQQRIDEMRVEQSSQRGLSLAVPSKTTRSTPGQSSIERNAPRSSGSPLVLYAESDTRGQEQDAQNARDQIMAQQAARVEGGRARVTQSPIERNPPPTSRTAPGQSGIERNKPAPKQPSGVTRTANPLAGSVALPPGVRPNVPTITSTQVRAVTPGGSRAVQSPAQSYAGQDRAPPAKVVAPKPPVTPPAALRLAVPSGGFAGEDRGVVTRVNAKIDNGKKTPSNVRAATPVVAPAAAPIAPRTPTKQIGAKPASVNTAKQGPLSLGETITGLFTEWSGIGAATSLLGSLTGSGDKINNDRRNRTYNADTNSWDDPNAPLSSIQRALSSGPARSISSMEGGSDRNQFARDERRRHS